MLIVGGTAALAAIAAYLLWFSLRKLLAKRKQGTAEAASRHARSEPESAHKVGGLGPV